MTKHRRLLSDGEKENSTESMISNGYTPESLQRASVEEASTKEGKCSPTTKRLKGSFYERSLDNAYEISVDESNLVSGDTKGSRGNQGMVQQSAGEKRRFRLIRGHITGG